MSRLDERIADLRTSTRQHSKCAPVLDSSSARDMLQSRDNMQWLDMPRACAAVGRVLHVASVQ